MQISMVLRDLVLLGPCPGCFSWQLEYSHGEMSQLYTVDEFEVVVEDILHAHMDECSGLKEIVDTP